MARGTLLTMAISMMAGLAFAGRADAQPSSASGTAVYVPLSTETVDLPDGRTLTRVRFSGYVLSDDATNPFRDTSQKCMGTAIGDVMNGYCDAMDADGDMYWFSWHNGPDGNTWRLIGGTGKFADMSGGGTSVSHPAGVEGQFRDKWTYTAD